LGYGRKEGEEYEGGLIVRGLGKKVFVGKVE
jgi:hypothetical protein